MFPLSKGRRFEHGLSFLATLAFLGGFFGARLFHLAFPGLEIITRESTSITSGTGSR